MATPPARRALLIVTLGVLALIVTATGPSVRSVIIGLLVFVLLASFRRENGGRR